MEKKYYVNYESKRTRDCIFRAMTFAASYFGKGARPCSQTLLDKYMGKGTRPLGKYLRSRLLVTEKNY